MVAVSLTGNEGGGRISNSPVEARNTYLWYAQGQISGLHHGYVFSDFLAAVSSGMHPRVVTAGHTPVLNVWAHIAESVTGPTSAWPRSHTEQPDLCAAARRVCPTEIVSLAAGPFGRRPACRCRLNTDPVSPREF